MICTVLGSDTSNIARYHPFYITDHNEGGYGQRTEEERKNQRVYAGVGYDTNQYPYPTAGNNIFILYIIPTPSRKYIVIYDLYVYIIAAGRYCEWAHTTVDRSSEFETFDDFFKTLKLQCDAGEPAYLNWTVAMETPDLVYYQVTLK
jgi:hypothetical protein